MISSGQLLEPGGQQTMENPEKMATFSNSGEDREARGSGAQQGQMDTKLRLVVLWELLSLSANAWGMPKWSPTISTNASEKSGAASLNLEKENGRLKSQRKQSRKEEGLTDTHDVISHDDETSNDHQIQPLDPSEIIQLDRGSQPVGPKRLPPTLPPPVETSSPWHTTESIELSPDYNEAWGFSMNHIPLQELENGMFSQNSNSRFGRSGRIFPGGGGHYGFWKAFNQGQVWCCFTRRRLCLVGLISGLLLTALMAVIMSLSLHHQESSGFDGSTGPQGGRPGPAPGRILPILDLLHNNHSQSKPSIYFGVSIDWKVDDPQHVNQVLNQSLAIQTTRVDIGEILYLNATVNSSGILHPIQDFLVWQGKLVRGTGAIFGIDLIPVDRVSTEAVEQFGTKCAELNALQIPIMVRFAPEMNGIFQRIFFRCF